MKRRLFLQNTAGVAGFVLLGCGDDDLPVSDSGPSPDASGDAGNDAGSSPDAGAVDAGAPDVGAPDVGAPDAGPPEPMCMNVTFIMGDDHPLPHAEGIEFPAADVIAGVEVTYDITGASRHPHTLVVTPEHFARLAAGEAVTIESSFDNRHVHDVTLMCSAS
ncbi:MAG: hypothetical protein AB8H86_24205 [Polyangiales bacterium]